MAGWSTSAQRLVWTVAALPFAWLTMIGGPVVATLLALWLRRGGRRRGRAWRLWWFVGACWAPLVLHVSLTALDIGVEHLRRTEFDAAAWRVGDVDDRTTMVHELVESAQLEGLDWGATDALLGDADLKTTERVHEYPFLVTTAYELERGGFGYRGLIVVELSRPMLVLEWEDHRVRRASIGRYFKGRPFPAPHDDD